MYIFSHETKQYSTRASQRPVYTNHSLTLACMNGENLEACTRGLVHQPVSHRLHS